MPFAQLPNSLCVNTLIADCHSPVENRRYRIRDEEKEGRRKRATSSRAIVLTSAVRAFSTTPFFASISLPAFLCKPGWCLNCRRKSEQIYVMANIVSSDTLHVLNKNWRELILSSLLNRFSSFVCGRATIDVNKLTVNNIGGCILVLYTGTSLVELEHRPSLPILPHGNFYNITRRGKELMQLI